MLLTAVIRMNAVSVRMRARNFLCLHAMKPLLQQRLRARRDAMLLAALWFCALPAGADTGLSLYLAEPSEPGRLELCERPAVENWVRYSGPLQLHWTNRSVELNAGAEPTTGTLPEHCFRLDLDGRPLVWGASVSRHSARFLNFPVLLHDYANPRDAWLRQSLVGEPAYFATWIQTLSRRFPAP